MPSQDDNRSDRPHISTSIERRRAGEVDQAAGKRLKARRIALNMTQQDLGALCHVSPQQIHKYEMGTSKISLARLLQFAEVLHVPITWFVEGVETHPGLPEDLVSLLSNPKNVQMLLAFDRISDDVAKSSLIRMTESFAELTSTSAPSRSLLAEL